MLIFLATIMKRAEALSVLERSIPWHDLTQFFAIIPHDIFSAQELNIPAGGSGRWAMLTSDCAPLLPEDWCLRGMGSVAKFDCSLERPATILTAAGEVRSWFSRIIRPPTFYQQTPFAGQ
jgi:hypothetical protein